MTPLASVCTSKSATPSPCAEELAPNAVADVDDETDEEEEKSLERKKLLPETLMGKMEKEQNQTLAAVDVKIGDGMDIDIHGENGESPD